MSDEATDRRKKVSACIITLNEENNLADCIGSVSFADEVLVVDSLSSDNTVKIAKELGAKVVEQEFLGHVRQKQLAVDTATHDWVFCIDADERVDDSLRESLTSALMNGDPDVAGYEVSRHVVYLGKQMNHGGWDSEWRLRLFDRTRGRWEGQDPHDRVSVEGRTKRLSGEMIHRNFRSLAHHLQTINRYTSIIAKQARERGDEPSLFRLVFRPPLRFIKMYFLRLGFLDGVRGFVAAWMGAFYVFMKYAKRWEK